MKLLSGKFVETQLTHGELKEGWFAVSSALLDGETDPMKARGSWYRISSKHGTVYRILRFCQNFRIPKSSETGQIALDWDATRVLYDKDNEVELQFERVGLCSSIVCAWKHPDPSTRLSLQLALILGTTSLMLGFLSIALTVCSRG